MSEKSVQINMGGWFLGLLTLVFVAAKLWGKITWSWWWVTAPLWMGAGFALSMMLIALVCLVLAGVARRRGW